MVTCLATPAIANSCLNEKGEVVDWFISLRWHGHTPRKYLIRDSVQNKWRWTTEDALLKPILSKVNANSDAVLAWNDEPPTSYHPSTSYAHSKGLLTFSKEENRGFFLSHSIPKYPEIDEEIGEINYISNTRSSYGQHVVCVSLNSGIEDLHLLWDQIQTAKPYVYHNTLIPSSRVNSLSTLYKLGKNLKLRNERRLGEFTFVTKSKSQMVPVFEGFLSPYWKQKLGNPGFFVETWGRPLLPSVCKEGSVVNIRKISYGGEIQKETQDHSKWAISTEEKLNLVCIGDLNHQNSQYKRGGSFLCLQNREVYRGFFQMITERDCTAEELEVCSF